MLTWRVEMCDFNLKKVPLAGRRFRFKAALAAIEPPSQPASQALEAPAARATREWALATKGCWRLRSKRLRT